MAGGDRNSGATDRRRVANGANFVFYVNGPAGWGTSTNWCQYEGPVNGWINYTGVIPGGSDNAYIDKGTCQVSDARSVSTAYLGTYCTANTGVPVLSGSSVLEIDSGGSLGGERRIGGGNTTPTLPAGLSISNPACRQCDRQRLCRERWQLLRHNYPRHRRIELKRNRRL